MKMRNKFDNINHSFAARLTKIILIYVLVIYIVAAGIISIFYLKNFEKQNYAGMQNELAKKSYDIANDVDNMYKIAIALSTNRKINEILSSTNRSIYQAVENKKDIQEIIDTLNLSEESTVNILTNNDNLYAMEYLSVIDDMEPMEHLSGRESKIYIDTADNEPKICILKNVSTNSEKTAYIKIEKKLSYYIKDYRNSDDKYALFWKDDAVNKYSLIYSNKIDFHNTDIKDYIDINRSRIIEIEENIAMLHGTLGFVGDNTFLVEHRRMTIICIFIIAVLIIFVIAFVIFYTVNVFSNKIVGILRKNGENNEELDFGHESELQEIKNKVEELLYENRKYNDKILKLEIENIQQRISPHFLFNNLSAICWTIDDERIDEIIGLLTEYYRDVFYKNEEFTNICEEMETVEKYIKLLKFSYGKEFEYSCEIPNRLKQVDIPSNIIQPIVENAFIYGVNKLMNSDGKIEIKVYKKQSNVVISVMNNGGNGELHKIEEKINHPSNKKMNSLYLINKRIKLYYGEDGGIQARKDGDFTCIDVFFRGDDQNGKG